MEGTKGQKYIINTFHAGINQDVDPEFMQPQGGQILYSEFLRLDDAVKGVLTALKGDDEHNAVGQDILDTYIYLGGMFVMGRIITFWFDSEAAAQTYIVLDNEIVGTSALLPGCANNTTHPLDMDHNPETGEIFITDDAITPIILNVQDLWDQMATTKYKADYDPVFYNIKLLNQAHQPKFYQLSDVGAGVGLKLGSYSYAVRYGTFQGEYTPWGPQTPYIPILESYLHNSAGNVTISILPGTRVFGGEPDIAASRYGIELRIRIENKAGFDFMELRRFANQAGAALGYTPAAELLRVTNDADGNAVDIHATEVGYLKFLDTTANIWTALDESEIEFKASIKAAKTIRYFDGRIILGGITYESRELVDEDIFINTPNVSKLAYPIKKFLDKKGYTEAENQVYFKSHRLGERYGYGAQLRDDQGNVLFTIPLRNDTDDFRNYKFPERREEVPASELAEMVDMTNMPILPTVASDGSTTDLAKTYEAHEQSYYNEGDARRDKYYPSNPYVTIMDEPTITAYRPFTPTGRDPGFAGNGRDYIGADCNYLVSAEGVAMYPKGFGSFIWATGLRIGGVDTTKLPAWVKGFSIVRTPPAGRVLCQGIATYALEEQDPDANPISLKKAKNKIWLYSPEMDPVIGDKANLYEDLKANPSDYQIQIVSPLGFWSEFLSAFNNGAGYSGKIDFVSWATTQRNSQLGDVLPFDSDAQVGNGDGYITFGRWRNTSGVEDTPPDYKSNHIWSISNALDVDIGGKNGRSQYLEITIDGGADDFYQEDECENVAATGTPRKFHEPFYIVNVIQNTKEIPLNQTDLYQEIGHYQKLRSIIGYGTGLDSSFFLADERPEDCMATGPWMPSTYSMIRYIEVDGQKWMDVRWEASGDVTTWTTELEANGFFVINSVNYYGVYNGWNRRGQSYIRFSHDFPTSGDPISPPVGAEITVVYNNTVPLDIYLGDNVVGMASFIPIDCQTSGGWNWDTGDKEAHFYMNAPMPTRTHIYDDKYRQMQAATETTKQILSYYNFFNQYIRQWAIMFVCESTVNLPLVYKNFFPHRHYVMRPNFYDLIAETENVGEYYERIGIAQGYQEDYPDEYLNWDRGGIHFPQGSNFDYEKGIGIKAPGKPDSSETEVVSYPKRLVWTLQKPTNRSSSNALKSILPTNYYDLTHHRSEKITLLYDAYSSRGNNLYVVTDQAVGLLLTDKTIVRDFVGDAMGIAAQEGNFIQAEQWINDRVGCPDYMWRGKTEGRIIKENRPIDILVFPTLDNIAVLIDNSIITLKDGSNKRISAMLNEYGTPENDDREDLFTSFIHTKQNELWINSQGTFYVYDFTHNAWTMEMPILHYVKGFYAPWLTGISGTDFTMMVWQGSNKYNRGVLEGNDYDTWDSMSQPDKEFVFVVNPGLGNTYQFTDMFIKLGAGSVPDTAEFGVAYTLGGSITDPATVVTADFKSYGDGWYECKIPKTTGNKVVIGNKMFVRLVGTNLHEIKYVKTGYVPVVGG